MDYNLTEKDISILKYYKQGNELCGFEGVHSNLLKNGYFNWDLELTQKAKDFIKKYPNWDNVKSFDNKMYIQIK